MEIINNQTEKYRRAKDRVKEIRDFYTHLVTYLIFIPVFIVINYYTTSFAWAIFPIAGWGIGVLSHAAETYGWNPFLGKDWERRKLEEFMRNDEF